MENPVDEHWAEVERHLGMEPPNAENFREAANRMARIIDYWEGIKAETPMSDPYDKEFSDVIAKHIGRLDRVHKRIREWGSGGQVDLGDLERTREYVKNLRKGDSMKHKEIIPMYREQWKERANLPRRRI